MGAPHLTCVGASKGEILDIARRERVDALLIGGDTFDNFAPAPEAEQK